jgi:hypothetical protein
MAGADLFARVRRAIPTDSIVVPSSLNAMSHPSLLECYRALELDPGADLAEVREAYRVLSRVWHPDRFAASPAMQARATARQQQLNGAYQALVRAYEENGGLPPPHDGAELTPSNTGQQPPATTTADAEASADRALRSRRLRVSLALGAALLLAALLTWRILNPDPRVKTVEGEHLRAAAVAVGGMYACAAYRVSAWCWGSGATTNAPSSSNAAPVATDGPVVAVAAGLLHACALTEHGQADCWGSNFAGQAGVGGVDDEPEPRRVAAGSALAAISSLGRHTCATTSDRALLCWGDDTDGQLGIGSPVASCTVGGVRFHCSDRPERIAGRWLSVSAGGSHTCGIAQDSVLYCWGSNRYGQVGALTTERCTGPGGAAPCSRRPVAVQVAPHATQVAAGASHTCALDDEGRAWCWGSNSHGQTGQASSGNSQTPVAVPTRLRFRELSTGAWHTCGLTSEREIYCWGSDADGELAGRARDDCSSVRCAIQPVRIARNAAAVSAGFGRTCGIVGDIVRCWGRGPELSDFDAPHAGSLPGNPLSRAYAAIRRTFHRLVIHPLERTF